MDKNAGYHLGLFIRRVRQRIYHLEEKATQRGLPRWMTKTFIVLIAIAVATLLLTYATSAIILIAVIVLIAFFIDKTSDIDDDNETSFRPLKHAHLEGYHSDGPEGAGTYAAGGKVSDDDEELIRPDEG